MRPVSGIVVRSDMWVLAMRQLPLDYRYHRFYVSCEAIEHVAVYFQNVTFPDVNLKGREMRLERWSGVRPWPVTP